MSQGPAEDRRPRRRHHGESAHAVARQRDTLQRRIARATTFPLSILSIVWTVLLFVELAVKLPPDVSSQILRVDGAIWFIFAVDFLVQLAIAPNKERYFRRHLLSAVALVLPFARVVQVLRVVRVLRTVSLVRILLISNRATRAAGRLFAEHRFGYVAFLVAITALLGAAAEYFFEQGVPGSPFQSFWNALWWSTSMLTTVPSQFDPVTAAGRVVAIIVRVVALAAGGYITASIATYLIGRQGSDESRAISELTRQIEELREQLRRGEAGQ